MRVDETALAGLAGKKIHEIRRAAKYILISLSEGLVWVFHLGMSGKLICVGADAPRRNTITSSCIWWVAAQLRYHDPRRFGLTLVTRKQILHELPQLRFVGIDPFDPDLTGEYLFRHTRSSDRRIRDLLLDQRIIGGLG